MRLYATCAAALLLSSCAPAPTVAQAAAKKNEAQNIEALTGAAGKTGASALADKLRSLGVAAAKPAEPTAGASVSTSSAARREGSTRPRTVAVRPSEPPVVPDEMQIKLPITFETNSAVLRPEAGTILTELCEALRQVSSENPDWTFNIIGHADASGTAEHNLRLSAARAREVKRHLVESCGVSAARLETFGLGNRRPLPGVPPVSEENRRVEVSVNAA
jgi:outer membrane protein OmpA-like peptidoglycan-associated protein